MREIDFTDCPRVPGLAYNGANGKKIAVAFEGIVCACRDFTRPERSSDVRRSSNVRRRART